MVMDLMNLENIGDGFDDDMSGNVVRKSTIVLL